MTEMRTGPNREQRCALHLMDLCRAYRDDPAPRAWASLEEYRVRGAELRRRAEFIRAAQARSPLDIAPVDQSRSPARRLGGAAEETQFAACGDAGAALADEEDVNSS
jgi:hypothetical protein